MISCFEGLYNLVSKFNGMFYYPIKFDAIISKNGKSKEGLICFQGDMWMVLIYRINLELCF
jgi:hypothetical protein